MIRAPTTAPAALAVERIAEWFATEMREFDPVAGAGWPEHENDTGYREGGYRYLQPSDVQAACRDNARRLLAFLDALRLTADAPTGPGVEEIARAIASAYGDAYPLASLPDTRFVSAGEYERWQEIDRGREDAARAVAALSTRPAPASAEPSEPDGIVERLRETIKLASGEGIIPTPTWLLRGALATITRLEGEKARAERELAAVLSHAAAKGEEPDLLLDRWREAEESTEAAEAREAELLRERDEAWEALTQMARSHDLYYAELSDKLVVSVNEAARLREALKPFAKAAALFDPDEFGTTIREEATAEIEGVETGISILHLRRARATGATS